MKLIEIEDICVRYDRKMIFDHVSLTINRGDFVAITGPNGGGKTTLLRVLLGLMKPDSGKVTYYNEQGVTKRLKIGYLPQKSNIDTNFPITVAEAIRSGQITGLFHRRSDEEDAEFRATARLCGVEDYLGQCVGELSGGQLQRTLLARALVARPEVIVLDEPLSYVDKAFERQIYGIIESLSRSHTIILVSHEMSIISGMANRHITVDRGIDTDTWPSSHINSIPEQNQLDIP